MSRRHLNCGLGVGGGGCIWSRWNEPQALDLGVGSAGRGEWCMRSWWNEPKAFECLVGVGWVRGNGRWNELEAFELG